MADAPTQPGLSSHDQHRAGRAKIYQTSFAEYEDQIRAQLVAMLGGHGFDFERDVAGLTLNRWPHGYAYEYNELWDDVEWGPENGPHVTARRPFGSIAIANSDASAYAYVDGAFDAAVRAVNDIMGGSRE